MRGVHHGHPLAGRGLPRERPGGGQRFGSSDVGVLPWGARLGGYGLAHGCAPGGSGSSMKERFLRQGTAEAEPSRNGRSPPRHFRGSDT
ncbi:hypothetical protein DB31_8768 [Hyalangium minutum]|uniref:Uncharacterized protein n=1 Tax=Hyalangium minutum TaxID=394096 RepID=A0A085WIA2_9BACT|nr:hypothetical protein DB31_8681 [Hyalangium minutum]KFE67415.1 hypothetical protein DB31_8768 [Hyalangium minutum]